jgi:hypothetical protein
MLSQENTDATGVAQEASETVCIHTYIHTYAHIHMYTGYVFTHTYVYKICMRIRYMQAGRQRVCQPVESHDNNSSF